jgi:periplasmic protein TonB
MELGRRHYLLACILALGLHLALAAALFWRPAPPAGQAMAAGTGGIEISLGPAGRVTDGPEHREEEEMDTPEPEPEPIPEPEPEPEPIPEPEPQPEPVPQPAPVPTPEASAERPVPAVAQATMTGAAGQPSTRAADDAGSGDSTAGGGLPGASQDYAATLLAWLERHKQYPRRARLRRQEGTVLLYFVVDRRGTVIEYRLERSSDHLALDEEVLAMIERAQPLPPMPEDMDREQLELIVPVEFFLR